MKKILLIIFLMLITNSHSAFAKSILADAEENNIQIFFLSPLKQKMPKNECKNCACKTLLKNINESKESINFALNNFN